MELAPCSAQAFMDAYPAAHHAKFGEEVSVVTTSSGYEYPNLPGRRENEVLGPFDMHILMQE